MVERPPLSALEQARLDTWCVDIAEEERGGSVASGEDYRIGDNRGLLVRANATWYDFASRIYGRGALTLLRYLRELELGQALGAAREWLADHAGNGRLSPGDDAEDGQASDDRERQVFIDAVWEGAGPVAGNPLAAAYFASRGLHPAPEDLAAMHWIPVSRGNESGLLFADTDSAGQLVAFQETMITATGEKSTIKPLRMTYRGPHDWARRGLVRFGDGEGYVYLTEGVEDALSIREAGVERVYACLGIALLGKARMPPGTHLVTVVRDGDADNSAADQCLWRGLVRLLGQGVTVQVTRRPVRVFGRDSGLKDANDVLKAHGVDGVRQLLDTAAAISDEMNGEAVADEASRLSDNEYETARKRLAGMLGWRKGRLDSDRLERRKARSGAGGGEEVNPDELPWPDPVSDVGEMLETALEKVKSYVAAQPADYITIVMWSILAHLLYRKDLKMNIAPRLAIQSAVTISGKTTVLTVVRDLCPRSEMVGTSTLSPIMRCIGFLRPTLCIDEADNLLTTEVRADLLGLLNSGHNRAGAYALRSEYDEKRKTWIPVKLPTFAPIAFAGLRQLPETLQNRSLRIQLRRALPGEVHAHLSEEGCPVLVECRRKLLRWATDLTHLQDVVLPPELINRHGDNWRPLFRIAATIGGPWPERVLAAALESLHVDGDGGEVVALLDAIWNVFNETKLVRMHTDTLIAGLGTQDEGRWLQVNNSKRIDAYYLREQLKGVIPNTEDMKKARRWRERGNPQFGYTEAHFEDGWARYLLKEPPSVFNKKHFHQTPPDSSDASDTSAETAANSKGNGVSDGGSDVSDVSDHPARPHSCASDDPTRLHASDPVKNGENKSKFNDFFGDVSDVSDELGGSEKNKKYPKSANTGRRRKSGNGGTYPGNERGT